MIRNFFKILAMAVAVTAFAVSCEKYNDSELREKISGLEDRVKTLEDQMAAANSNIQGLKDIVAALEKKLTVSSVKETSEGWVLSMSNGETITIKNGVSPIIGVKEKDGVYYWTVNGEWLLDGDGKMLPVTGPAGADAIAPQVKIEDGYWYLSVDGGTSWTKLDKATGEDGSSVFASVVEDEYYVYLTLFNDYTIRIPLCDVATILTRIQSIVYVPDYDDGKITVNSAMVSYGTEAVLMDQPTEITYQILPADLAPVLADNIFEWNRYMNPAADDWWALYRYITEENLPDLDEISGQAFRDFLKEYGIHDIFAWFDVRPVNTRSGGDDAKEQYGLKILDVVKADGNTGEITFKVMPFNIASASFAAAGIKPVEGVYMTGNTWDVNYRYENYGLFWDASSMESGADYYNRFISNNWVYYVYNVEDLQAYEARSAFAVQLRLYQLQDYAMTFDDETQDYIYKDYDNELASTYTGLYPNILDPIELLPGAYMPDPYGNLVSIDGKDEYQTLPYNVFRKDGTSAEPGYRTIMEGATPAFVINGETVSAKKAYEMGYKLPGYEFLIDYNYIGDDLDDIVILTRNEDGLLEVEMDPDALEDARKKAVGSSVEGIYIFKTPFGDIGGKGYVTITDGSGDDPVYPPASGDGYDLLHLRYYTFNSKTEAADLITKRDFDDNDGSVEWWGQIYPSYFTDVSQTAGAAWGPESDTRVSNRYALADYSPSPIDLAELSFNIVDGKDHILNYDEIDAAGLEVEFEYTDGTLGSRILPPVNQDAGFLYYNELWLDKTTFFYYTNEKPFIPVKARLYKKTDSGRTELPTRFSKPKASVDQPSVMLDYSSFSIVRWTPFKKLHATNLEVPFNGPSPYTPIFRGIDLMDRRPNGVSFYVLSYGEWVLGNAPADATSSSVTNGYLDGVSSRDAYHLGDLFFSYDMSNVPYEMRQNIKFVYSYEGQRFSDDQNPGTMPYIFIETSGIDFQGRLDIPVHVELPNPWQETLTADFTVTIVGGDTVDQHGTVNTPYSVQEAIDAVKDLTWTSNTDYESTHEVYVKGIISRIASGGTFTEGGTYGNASFYISDNGEANNEFYCFRILYLGNQKFTPGQTDIKVGDEVVICGKLMNYRENTPETVAGKAYLYSLN